MSNSVALRAATADDAAFLRRLYLDTHPDLAALPAGQLDVVVDLQLHAQRQQYRQSHPDAQDEVILVDGIPVGRCWTAETEGEIRLLDLAVLGAARGAGVGTAVVRGLCERAGSTGRTVGLHVWSGNEAARRLYERLGFRAVAERNGYLALQWEPSGPEC